MHMHIICICVCICNIPPEVIKAAGPQFQSGLRDLFMLVWKSKEIHGGRRKSIILQQFKGKDSKMECSNFIRITLLSAPEYFFAHILLHRIKPLIHAKRRQEQSGFTLGRWNGGTYPDPWHPGPNKKRISSTTLCGVR